MGSYLANCITLILKLLEGLNRSLESKLGGSWLDIREVLSTTSIALTENSALTAKLVPTQV